MHYAALSKWMCDKKSFPLYFVPVIDNKEK
jgi:hypothetical protein